MPILRAIRNNYQNGIEEPIKEIYKYTQVLPELCNGTIAIQKYSINSFELIDNIYNKNLKHSVQIKQLSFTPNVSKNEVIKEGVDFKDLFSKYQVYGGISGDDSTGYTLTYAINSTSFVDGSCLYDCNTVNKEILKHLEEGNYEMKASDTLLFDTQNLKKAYE